MIFKPELVAKILAGEKTVTRRPCKLDPYGGYLPLDCRYGVGRDYALQDRRTGPGLGPRLLIRDVRGPEPVWHVRFGGDPRLEGFSAGDAGYEEFIAYWKGLHGKWDPDTLVYRIEFEVVRA